MERPTDILQTRYVIISPVRDEETYIAETIRSVVSQSVRPAEWIIVNDGSRDRTPTLIDECARRYPWISAIHRIDRGKRVPGTGVMEAFYTGYQALQTQNWEFIVKLDGDVGLEPDYFQSCFARFRDEPPLGICGGMMYCIRSGRLEIEPHPTFHVRGPIKLYRRACWNDIGGLVRAPGWDTIDEVKANMLGWQTRSFPDLRVVHYRPTGGVQGVWKDGVKDGRADYISGYHPLFMAAKCAKRLFQKPFLRGAIAHACGYIGGYLMRVPRVEDPAMIRYIRSQQLRRLILMKSIWK